MPLPSVLCPNCGRAKYPGSCFLPIWNFIYLIHKSAVVLKLTFFFWLLVCSAGMRLNGFFPWALLWKMFHMPAGPREKCAPYLFCIFAHFLHFLCIFRIFTPNREGRATLGWARGPICGLKWTKKHIKIWPQGCSKCSEFCFGPKIMLFYHKFILGFLCQGSPQTHKS